MIGGGCGCRGTWCRNGNRCRCGNWCRDGNWDRKRGWRLVPQGLVKQRVPVDPLVHGTNPVPGGNTVDAAVDVHRLHDLGSSRQQDRRDHSGTGAMVPESGSLHIVSSVNIVFKPVTYHQASYLCREMNALHLGESIGAAHRHGLGNLDLAEDGL